MERVVRQLTPEEELARKLDCERVRLTNEAKREVYGEWAAQQVDGSEPSALGARPSWDQCVAFVGLDRVKRMEAEIEERFQAWKAAEGL